MTEAIAVLAAIVSGVIGYANGDWQWAALVCAAAGVLDWTQGAPLLRRLDKHSDLSGPAVAAVGAVTGGVAGAAIWLLFSIAGFVIG